MATPAFLAGSASVALLLFGTRWGSYLGFGGVVFLSDLLMAGAVVLTVLRSARGTSVLPAGASRVAVPWLILLTGGYALLRFLTGGDYSIVAIRDAAPYIYILLGLLAFYTVRRVTPEQLDRTMRLFVVVLTGHAIWYSAVLAFPDLPAFFPLLNATQEIYVFTARPDVDCPLIGVLAAYLLWRAFRYRRYVPVLLALYVACWVPIALSLTRAGLLGAGTATAFVLLIVLTDGRRTALDRAAIAFALVFAALAGGGFVLTSDVGTKFIATVAPDAVGDSATGEGAEGTTSARSNSWDRLVEWTYEDAGRGAVGVGFGPNFLKDSGASALLVGEALEEDVTPRSPHNFWLGSQARLGVVGLALLVGLVGMTVLRAWRLRAQARDIRFVLVVTCLFLSLILPATFGVVLESPFGAIPFWWSVGCLLGLATTIPRALRRQRRSISSASGRAEQ